MTNPSINKKQIWLVAAISLLIATSAYFMLGKQAIPGGKPSQTQSPQTSPITVSGELVCLTKLGSGAQTLECAIGLKAADGKRYGLKHLSNADPKLSRLGLKVQISGTFSSEALKGPDGNTYDTVGTIDVTSVKTE